MGYRPLYKVLSSRDFGVPQNRELNGLQIDVVCDARRRCRVPQFVGDEAQVSGAADEEVQA